MFDQNRLRLVATLLGALLSAGPAGAQQVLEARPTTQPPRLDGALDDPAWRAARPISVLVYQVPSAKHGGNTTVELRATYTDRDLYLSAKWQDRTNSIRKEQWTFDGTQWTQDPDQDEDRFSLVFPIADSVPWFAAQGCATACHARTDRPAENPGWYMATLGPTERLDCWHWKAVRTNSAGYVDDKYWDHLPPAPGRKNAGRHYDARAPGPSPAAANRGRGGPAFMQDPNKKPSMPGFLLRSEAVPFDASRFKAGDTVPGRVLAKPAGSQADVACAGVWRDGAWHLEIRRALDTGHDDDVVFTPGRTVPFALALFDNVSERRKQDHGRAMSLLRLKLAE